MFRISTLRPLDLSNRRTRISRSSQICIFLTLCLLYTVSYRIVGRTQYICLVLKMNISTSCSTFAGCVSSSSHHLPQPGRLLFPDSVPHVQKHIYVDISSDENCGWTVDVAEQARLRKEHLYSSYQVIIIETVAYLSFTSSPRIHAIYTMWAVSLSLFYDQVNYSRSLGSFTCLNSSITTVTVSPSLTTTINGLDDFEASQSVWWSSYDLFQSSVSSAHAAGRYPTAISTDEYTNTFVYYSYIDTYDDGIARLLTAFPTFTEAKCVHHL